MIKYDGPWDSLWVNGQIYPFESDITVIYPGAIAIRQNKIAWIGPVTELPPEHRAIKMVDLKGKCLTPGFIDCHTHLVYAGNRSQEFLQRQQGISYQEIAKQGGGIMATVNATRSASYETLYEESFIRAKALADSGVTTIEIKSGYGLDLATELKILGVAKAIEKSLPLSVYRTFLGAHTIPPEFKTKPNQYVDLICNEMIPYIAQEKAADAIDVFCEKIAFDLEQTERIFQTTSHYHLAIKCHSEQLSFMESAKLAARYQAISVDHLEYADRESIDALAKANTVAVLLPGAYYYLREKQKPLIAYLREQKVPIAIASDCNPGTSPIVSILVILNMANILFGLTIDECLLGVTKHAAQALGREKEIGTLKVGKVADFLVWDTKNILDLIYYLGQNPIWAKIKNGKEINVSPKQ